MISLSQIFDQALQLHRANNLGEAGRLYKQILSTDPRHAYAHQLLGVIYCQVGRHELAIEHLRSAIRERPNLAAAHCNLGCALQILGRVTEAVASFRQAVHFSPGHAQLHNNLGTGLQLQNNLVEAEACYREALRLQPDHAEAWNNLGIALKDQGKLDEATAAIEQALRFKPDYIEAHKNLASVREKQGRRNEALAGFEQALRLQPESPNACLELAQLLSSRGDRAGAEQAARSVLRLEPGNSTALALLVSLHRGRLAPDDRAVLEQRLADPALEDPDRARLLYSLAEVHDFQGHYDQAAAELRQANGLILTIQRQKGMAYDSDTNSRIIDNIIAGFTPAFFERTRGFGLDTQCPIFIVGLPRSGTTLIEQILAAHPHVFGAGELTLARESFLALGTSPGMHATDAASFAALPNLQRETVRDVAQRHLDQLTGLGGSAARIVDKLPENYIYLGLLATLFPRAKFIHCRRDLRDVAVSLWMTNFLNYQWANDTAHIAAHIRDYHRVMNHWRATLPISILDIHYEETVADLPRAARLLLEWCELDWDPACLSFHEARNPVRTASVFQVREPVHGKSVARWRHYERDLGVLFAAVNALQESRGPQSDE